MMVAPINGRAGTATCAKGTLQAWTRRCARTGGVVTLLMGAVLASTFLVDPPSSLERAPEVRPYVPASDAWIEVGSEPGLVSRIKAPIEVAPADQAVAPGSQVEQGKLEPSKEQRRKPRRGSSPSSNARVETKASPKAA